MARPSSGIMKKKKLLNVRGRSFKVRGHHNGRQSQHRWKLPKVDKKRQEMNMRDEIELDPSNPSNFEDMFDGKFSGFLASIMVLQDNVHVSRKFQTLRKLSTSPHNNILAFFGARKDESNRYLFAFEQPFCTLADYMLWARVDVERLGERWLNILRGIIEGVKHMHQLELSHGNITPWSAFVTKDGILKLGGLNDCSELTRKKEALDYEMVANVIAFCLSDMRHTVKKDDYMNYDFYSRMHLHTKEAQAVVNILRSRAKDALTKVLVYPMFWLAEKRVFFFKEVQEMIFDKQILIVDKANINALARKCWNPRTNNGWVTRFHTEIMQVQDPPKNKNNKKRKQLYIGTDSVCRKNRKSVCELIKFMRNIYSHHLEVGRKLMNKYGRNHLGDTTEELELVYRRAFPNLLVNLYDEMKRQNLDTTKKLAKFYSPSL